MQRFSIARSGLQIFSRGLGYRAIPLGAHSKKQVGFGACKQLCVFSTTPLNRATYYEEPQPDYEQRKAELQSLNRRIYLFGMACALFYIFYVAAIQAEVQSHIFAILKERYPIEDCIKDPECRAIWTLLCYMCGCGGVASQAPVSTAIPAEEMVEESTSEISDAQQEYQDENRSFEELSSGEQPLHLRRPKYANVKREMAPIAVGDMTHVPAMLSKDAAIEILTMTLGGKRSDKPRAEALLSWLVDAGMLSRSKVHAEEALDSEVDGVMPSEALVGVVSFAWVNAPEDVRSLLNEDMLDVAKVFEQ